MKKYKVTVSGMTATYSGIVTANTREEAIEKVKEAYRRNQDDRLHWNFYAREYRDKEG